MKYFKIIMPEDLTSEVQLSNNTLVQCVSKKMILCEKMAKIRNPENALFLKKPSTTFSKNSFKFQI